MSALLDRFLRLPLLLLRLVSLAFQYKYGWTKSVPVRGTIWRVRIIFTAYGPWHGRQPTLPRRDFRRRRRSCRSRNPFPGFVGGRLSGDLLCRRRRAAGGGAKPHPLLYSA